MAVSRANDSGRQAALGRVCKCFGSFGAGGTVGGVRHHERSVMQRPCWLTTATALTMSLAASVHAAVVGDLNVVGSIELSGTTIAFAPFGPSPVNAIVMSSTGSFSGLLGSGASIQSLSSAAGASAVSNAITLTSAPMLHFD